MTDTPRHSVSVAGVVVDDDDQVLVIQRQDNSHWEPPGGVLELHETPEQGVRREVHEETGLAVSVEGLSGIYKNMNRGIIALVFRCRPIGGSLAVSDETKSVRWVTANQAKKLMDEAYAIRVSDAFEEVVNVRSHDGQELLYTSTSR